MAFDGEGLGSCSEAVDMAGYNKFNLNKFSEISSETGNLEIR